MQFNFTRFIYDRNFALHYSERLESIRVLGTDKRSALMISVKANSKSELVGDSPRDTVVICCCDGRLLSRAVICGHTVQI